MEAAGAESTQEKYVDFLASRKVLKEAVPLPRPEGSDSMERARLMIGILRKKSTDMCIYKVPKELRKVNEDAYSPRIVSIGPLHADDHDHLLAMEEHKWQHMLSLLERTGNEMATLNKCGEELLVLEPEVRGSYAKTIEFNSHELVEIMLVDGCFIIELFLRYSNPDFNNDSDLIIRTAWMFQAVKHDLVLLENQIPFSVLEKLLDIVVGFIPRHKRPTQSVTDLVLSFFHPDLDLNQEAIIKTCQKSDRHILDVLHNFYVPKSRKLKSINKEARGFQKSATGLLEAGIEFEKGAEDHLLDLEFSNGVLKIPPLCIDETMDSLLMNLIAFEQCGLGTTHYITSYAILIKSLIRSLPDIELLQEKEIIRNKLGGVQDVLVFFNNISKEIVLKDFYFSKLCEEVNKHQNSWWQRHSQRAFWRVWWHRQIAALKRNYFPNAWRSMSVIAAVVLLFLTALQTVYTVWSF